MCSELTVNSILSQLRIVMTNVYNNISKKYLSLGVVLTEIVNEEVTDYV